MTLSELATKHGTDKGPEGHGYTEIYEDIFATLPENPNLLEIGVDTGASLKMWREYRPGAFVGAVDIKDLREIAESAGANFAHGDAHCHDFLKRSFTGCSFDLVIDDGSHQVAGWRAVVTAFLPRISPGGYLVIEDIHSWPDGWEGTTDAPLFFAGLIHASINASRKHSNHLWDGVIESVTFIKGLCIIRRVSK